MESRILKGRAGKRNVKRNSQRRGSKRRVKVLRTRESPIQRPANSDSQKLRIVRSMSSTIQLKPKKILNKRKDG